MKNINYTGSFLLKLEEALDKNPNLTIGEILYSILRTKNLKGKHFFYATDEELYTALENFLKFEEEEDEPLSEQAFSFWVEQKTIIK